MKIKEYRVIECIIQCVGIVLLALILIIMGYAIKSKQEQIEAIESAYTSLQEHYNTVSDTNYSLMYEIDELQTQLIEQKEIEVTKLQNLIEPIKNTDKELWFTLYKKVEEEYSDYFGKADNVYDCFTEEQINMMWKCIETETYQCNFNSKVNVACVILNRIENEQFPLDPIEIITSPNQFAYGRNIITEDTKLALEYAFSIEDTTDGCIAFRSDCSPNEWNGWTKQFTDESGHTFYK